MKKIIIFSLIIFCMLFLFCSCKYTVNYDVNGGNLITESEELSYNKAYSLPIPKKPGYRFLGWYYGDELIPSTGNWPFKENVSLVAKWEMMEYQIIYELDGGTIEGEKVVGFNYDSPEIIIKVPTKAGFLFSHWEDENGNKYQGDFVIKSGTDKDIYLKAVWWDFEENGVKYFYENDELVVYTYDGNGQHEIIIPNELYGKKVTTIREGAFKNLGKMVAGQETIYRVYLSDSIEYIGRNAFYGCQNVKVVFSVSSNDDYIAKTTEWLEKVIIESEGNQYFEDVVLRKRPAFNSSEYVQIDK